MLRKLIEIHNISAVQQNLSHNIYGLKEIQYEENIVGKGGVGYVFNVVNIDGKTESGLLIKIISDKDLIEKSHETISILHDKLNRHQDVTGIPVFMEVPELNGLPFIAFKAKIDGSDEVVAGYLMRNLSYYDYNDFGSENWVQNEYITEIGFEEKLYLCYQFARGVNFLHEQKFIHSDLKDYSIFINQKKPQLSIIDYDGGYHYDKQEFALTIGAITAWASSKWRVLIGQGKSSKDVSHKERLDEENWILASGLFQLLFGMPPFYFLKSIEGDSIDNYLKSNEWPNYKENSSEINQQNLSYHKILLNAFEVLKKEGLKPIIDAFTKVFNEGHAKESKRLTPKQWKDLLFEINKQFVGSPKIESFSSNKNTINAKNELVEFKWNASFFRSVYLDGQLQDTLVNSKEIPIQDSKDVEIRFVNDFGESTEKIKIDANKVEPVIINFSSDSNHRLDLTPVQLSWRTENTANVSITNIGDNYPSNGSTEVNPIEKTKYFLNAIGLFDQKVTAEVEVDVELAKINVFKYEINIEKGIDNVDLYWETENATEVEISPNIGKVELNGATSKGISEKTEFTIKAKGYFNEIEKTIEAQPFPIPIIKGLFIPTPILNLETAVPSNLLEIPPALAEALKVDLNNSVNYNSPEPSFINFNESQIVKNQTDISDKNIHSISGLFNNLFNRINKK